MKKARKTLASILDLKAKRAEVIMRYKRHEITARECVAEKNRLDDLIQKELRIGGTEWRRTKSHCKSYKRRRVDE